LVLRPAALPAIEPEPRAPAAAAERPSDAKRCNESGFRIVIDVGHTMAAPGATSSRGVPEHTFNLALAKQVAKDLADGGFVHTTLLLTEGIGRAQLMQRAVRANALRPDLFLSIHHDSVQSIYLERWRHNGRPHLFSDRFSGYSLFVSQANAHASASLSFAGLLAAELMGRGMRFTTHHAEDIPGERRELIDPQRGIYRYDQLVVLKHTRAPSVLLEAGIIVNRQEEVVLASPERRRMVSAAIRTAITEFCRTTKSGLRENSP
jgi:N-acetylmuramoyl-L-alanine amidase